MLVTNGPVIAAAETALRDALGARNMLMQGGARFRLDARVERFDCNQLFPREAHLWMVVSLIDASSGAMVYEHRTHINKAEGAIGGGIFAAVEPLRAIANAALQEGVDQALDGPGLRAALASEPAPAAATGEPALATPEEAAQAPAP